jgi:hypothetical protein
MKRNLAQLYNPIKYFHLECPKCSSEIDYLDVKIGFKLRYETDYWECTACKSLLCVSRVYAWSIFLGTLAVALMITWALEIHSWFLFIPVAVVAWLIVAMFAGAYVKWLFPPKIQLYSPYYPSLFTRR